MKHVRFVGLISATSAILLLNLWVSEANDTSSSESAVHTIKDFDHLTSVLSSSGKDLLVFDLYADWCGPCKILSPMLEEIAREKKEEATVYKINVDKNPQIASAFGVRGIPYVVFVQDKKAVHAMTGVHPKDNYIRAIDLLTQKDTTGSSSAETDIAPNGKIVQGVRVIDLDPGMEIGDLYVYRGETVKLVMNDPSYTFSFHVPEFGISHKGKGGVPAEIKFKAEKVGVFPMFCNGDCPVGDGAQVGRIIVMQYKGHNDVQYTELTAKKAVEVLKSKKGVLVDVRTPAEYYRGHIQGARLVPLQQLEQRLSELSDFKKKPVILYCRTGNRSTVAAQILAENGFTNIFHISDGIVGWEKAGNSVVSERNTPAKTIVD